MFYTKNEKKVRIDAATYALELDSENISVILAGEEISTLRPRSAVNTVVNGEVSEDGAEGTLTFTSEKADEGYVFTWSGKSKNWDKAEYVLYAKENHFEYFIRVSGKGDVDTVNYFVGDICADVKGSHYDFDTGYMPIPTVDGGLQCEFSAQRTYDEFSYLTVPPMFCYTFDICGMDKKLALALAADENQHNFTKFSYKNHCSGYMQYFWLWTNQDGHTHVDGEWTSPMILGYGADSRQDSLKYYSDFYFGTGRAVAKDPTEKKPRFWYGPMACGWVQQTSYGSIFHEGGGTYAAQKVYDHFFSELDRRDLRPQIMIIDDKWQVTYGGAEVDTDKWPDMRTWIDTQRDTRGCYTMLWYKLWDAEGLSEDMTMPNGKGGRCADPTSPKYREYVRETMHRLLSSDEGCVNAYGLKLDYAFEQPLGRDAVSADGKYGVELYLELIKLIYECAKEAKPEAVISGSPCHPVFAQYIDHARLHDYFPALRRCYEEFEFRKNIYTTALPGALVDTDGAGFRSRRDTMRYMRLAPKLGIPDLYCVSGLEGCQQLTDEDWSAVASVWREYSELIDNIVK